MSCLTQCFHQSKLNPKKIPLCFICPYDVLKFFQVLCCKYIILVNCGSQMAPVKNMPMNCFYIGAMNIALSWGKGWGKGCLYIFVHSCGMFTRCWTLGEILASGPFLGRFTTVTSVHHLEIMAFTVVWWSPTTLKCLCKHFQTDVLQHFIPLLLWNLLWSWHRVLVEMWEWIHPDGMV